MWVEHCVVELQERVVKGVERPLVSDRVLETDDEPGVDEPIECRSKVGNSPANPVRDRSGRDGPVGDCGQDAVVDQRSGSGHDRVFGEQRGCLVSHGGTGREDPLNDPTVHVTSTIRQVKVDHVGGIADNASDGGVHLHCGLQVGWVVEALGGGSIIVGVHDEFHASAPPQGRFTGGQGPHHRDSRSAENKSRLA
ncbi:unannotated protein [freshwater metagenome]|uniref:Unannotated protein n=1 Tax=freshwater metagenome TaxID=449393 RepID=A0A6J6VPK6_9ZZZZ